MTKVQHPETHIQTIIRKMALEQKEAKPFSDLPEHATFTLLGPDAPASETLRKIQPDIRGSNAVSLDGYAHWRIPTAWLCLPEYTEHAQAAA